MSLPEQNLSLAAGCHSAVRCTSWNTAGTLQGKLHAGVERESRTAIGDRSDGDIGGNRERSRPFRVGLGEARDLVTHKRDEDKNEVRLLYLILSN